MTTIKIEVNTKVIPYHSLFEGISLPVELIPLKLYRLSQDTKRYGTFGTYYESCIVVAPNEEAAKCIHPSGDNDAFTYSGDVWPNNLDLIQVEELGIANSKQVEGTVLCADSSNG